MCVFIHMNIRTNMYKKILTTSLICFLKGTYMPKKDNMASQKHTVTILIHIHILILSHGT